MVVIWEHELKKAALPVTRRALYDAVRRADDPSYDEVLEREAVAAAAAADAAEAGVRE